MNVIKAIVQAITAQENCERNGAPITAQMWGEVIRRLASECLPSGSGFDAGTTIGGAGDRCVFLHTSYHHMNQHGFYDGWTEHTISVRPSFLHELDISIGGRDRNGIKDVIHDAMNAALRAEVPYRCTYSAILHEDQEEKI